jgi:hypothetical protein
MDKPQSDEEWIIHSLNIHGLFFERWCQSVIVRTGGFDLVASNKPVEFPPAGHAATTKESSLDIQAIHTYGNDARLTLTLECKKNNPSFVNWIFFPVFQPRRHVLELSQIHNTAKQNGNHISWTVELDKTRTFLDEALIFCDDARETRGSYQNTNSSPTLTKTSNAAVSEAAYQVALASQAVLFELVVDNQRRSASGGQTSWPENRHSLLPIIVTSAKLFTCRFDPKSVTPDLGEIPLKEADLVSQKFLVFRYKLPKHLQYGYSDFTEEKLMRFASMDIVVVHSEDFETFLDKLRTHGEFSFF